MEPSGRRSPGYGSASSPSAAGGAQYRGPPDDGQPFAPGVAPPTRQRDAPHGSAYQHQEGYSHPASTREGEQIPYEAPRYRPRPSAMDDASRSAAGEAYAEQDLRRRQTDDRRWDTRDERTYEGGEHGYRTGARPYLYADDPARDRYEQSRWHSGYDRQPQQYHQQSASAGQHRDEYAQAYRYGPNGDMSRYDEQSGERARNQLQGGSQRDSTSGVIAAGPATPATSGVPAEHPARYGSQRGQAAAPEGFSKVSNGRHYRLVVMQHPNRARMCGFGDKDRRPLSPTLIVKLIITDEATGREISPLDVNTSLFLLATDLCHPDDLMLAPRNILVHHNAPSFPMSSLGFSSGAQSHASTSAQSSHPYQSDYATNAERDSSLPAADRASGLAEPGDPNNGGGQLPPIAALDLPGRSRAPSDGLRDSPLGQSRAFGGSPSHGAQQSPMFPAGFARGPAESYTRNLVGAAVASASVLKDESEKWCTFFVFQDISVRSEGVYRIKLVFVNLEVNGRVGTGVSEALAETYTDPFTVYSPRKFPGMLDPTPLSRKLASQGIKIPVRNDKKKQRRRADDGAGGGYEDEQNDDDNDDE